jgi:hypothetical protein
MDPTKIFSSSLLHSLWNNPFTSRGAQALLEGLQNQNMTLHSVTTFSGFPCTKGIQYYTHLNRAGRYLLREDGKQPYHNDYDQQPEYRNGGGGDNQFYHHNDDEDSSSSSSSSNNNKKGRVPLALWPIVLGRVNEQHWSTQQSSSVLYTLLKEGPAIIASR